MPSRPRPELVALVVLAAVVVVGALVLAWRESDVQPPAGAPATWRGLVGPAHPVVSTEQRQIVVLRAPSVAQRVERAGSATEDDERRWTAQALAGQEAILSLLAAQGVGVRPDYSYARVLNGFAATLDPRALALLHQSPEVAGIYPVRAAFPAALSTASVTRAEVDALAPRGVELPGFDGRGVSIALLDTGVDRTHPYLNGRVEPGLDLINGNEDAAPVANPDRPEELERHGTQLAGLLVGFGGPGGLRGVAPAASLFPIRIAGWQPDAEGRSAVYARTDQLIAGLDRAVDPNDDGDAHDAPRIALLGVAIPFAGFTDSPEARAVAGALALDMLVVAPAGNDGPAGPLFGAVAGPGGAPAALTVGATDGRPTTSTVHTVLRTGLEVLLDAELPLLGATGPRATEELALGVPRRSGATPVAFFDLRGFSLVAGRAALVPAGADPGAAVVDAARAGAAAVLLYGEGPPPGSLGLTNELGIPVVSVPEESVRAILAARREGSEVAVALGRVRHVDNEGRGRIAPFSSRGLSYGGFVKPDVSAPGAGLATADPGMTPDGEPGFATLNGTSAAAASVAGAAALLAQARPGLGARELGGLLAGYARPAAGTTPAAEGSGGVDLGASAAGELIASTRSISFGAWGGPTWRSKRTFFIRNVSTRRLVVNAEALTSSELEPLRFRVEPRRVVLRQGRSAKITVTARAARRPSHAAAMGMIALRPAGSQTLRLPWAIAFPRAAKSLLPRVTLDRKAFVPSDVDPAVLRVRAGRILDREPIEIVPVSRLDVLLYTSRGTFVGLLSRVRDMLPGSYSFGITGRGPIGARLARGSYELRLVAWSTLGGQVSRARVRFEIL